MLARIVGCCVNILPILKEFNTWFEGKREFLKNIAANFQQLTNNSQFSKAIFYTFELYPCPANLCTHYKWAGSVMEGAELGSIMTEIRNKDN